MDETPRNILMNPYPRESTALYESKGDRAIIETSDGKVFSYEDSRPSGERFVEESVGFHPGMWLPKMPGIIYKRQPSGPYPFTALELRLRQLKQVYYAVELFRLTLDPDMDINVRRDCVEHVTELFDDAAIYDAARLQLMERPLPDCIDVEHSFKGGKGAELLKALREKWHPVGWKDYVVSLRRGKTLGDLGVKDVEYLVDALRALDLAIVEVMPTRMTVVIRANEERVARLRDTLAACHIVERTTGHAYLASMN